MYDRIIVALDGSPLAEQVLSYVGALAESFGSTLILVRAILPLEKVAALIEPAVAGVPLDPYGRTRLGRLIFGSVADEVLHGRPDPCCLYARVPTQVPADPHG
jgi:nucleotide-binding universal stress UspA family protein